MTADACQIKEAVEAELASLCMTCALRGSCLKELVARQIGERMDEGTYQVQLLDECEDYEDDGSGAHAHGSLRPLAYGAGVRDLCCGCPSARTGACRKRSDLDELTRVAFRDGSFVHVAVIACKPSGGLHRIADPREK